MCWPASEEHVYKQCSRCGCLVRHWGVRISSEHRSHVFNSQSSVTATKFLNRFYSRAMLLPSLGLAHTLFFPSPLTPTPLAPHLPLRRPPQIASTAAMTCKGCEAHPKWGHRVQHMPYLAVFFCCHFSSTVCIHLSLFVHFYGSYSLGKGGRVGNGQI